MGLPAEVKKQGREAEKLHAQMYPDTTAGEETPPKEPAKAEDTPAEVTPIAPAEPAPVPPAPVEPVPAPIDYEHKYKVLQGKYNAEVPRLQQQVGSLETLLGSMQQQQKAAEQTPAPAKKAASLLTEEEIEDYGPEMIDVIQRAARQMMEPELDTLRNENAQLKEQVGGVTQNVQLSAREAMFSSLSDQIPNWQAVNKDPSFKEWLQEVDLYSGAVRHQMLLAAFERNDTARVAAFFNGYLGENALVTPADPAAQAPANKVDLNTLVAPGSAHEGSQRAQEGEKRIWMEADVAKFYADVTAGKFRGKEKEKNRLEKDIFNAGNEGRIR